MTIDDFHERSRLVKLGLWNAHCARHRVLGRAVPLFSHDRDLCVATSAYVHHHRLVLTRSPEMERLIVEEAGKVLGGGASYDGILYMMFWPDEAGVIPLYVGKAGREGRIPGTISANLAKIGTDRGKFARWGSGYAYHIGDLSAVVCRGHDEAKRRPKYRRWAERLFVKSPDERPRLRRPVHFWCTAWSADSPSIWEDFGTTSLAFEEYLMIGVASVLFPGALLNDEGVNRRGKGAAE